LTDGEGVVANYPTDESKHKDFTVSVWLRLDAEQVQTSPWLSFLLKGNDHSSSRMPGMFIKSKDLTLALCVTTAGDWNTTIRSTKSIEINKWTHLCVTYRNNVCSLFVNGELDNSLELSTVPIHNKEPWYIGKCPSGVKKPCAEYPGISGHVASLYHGNKALDASDVSSLAACPPTVAVDVIGENMVRPTTRLKLGAGGVVTAITHKFPSTFTLEALIVAKSLPEKYNCLISQGSTTTGGFGFGISQSGALYFEMFKKETFRGKSGFVVPGKLHHVAMVFSASEVSFYVDGFVAGVHSASHEMIEMPFSPLKIGATQKGFDGELLDVRVWHEAKTCKQVQEGMSRRSPCCFNAKTMRGKIPRCSNDHPLTISTSGGSECKECKARYTRGGQILCAYVDCVFLFSTFFFFLPHHL
jgi:hypothetical protein